MHRGVLHTAALAERNARICEHVVFACACARRRLIGQLMSLRGDQAVDEMLRARPRAPLAHVGFRGGRASAWLNVSCKRSGYTSTVSPAQVVECRVPLAQRKGLVLRGIGAQGRPWPPTGGRSPGSHGGLRSPLSLRTGQARPLPRRPGGRCERRSVGAPRGCNA